MTPPRAIYPRSVIALTELSRTWIGALLGGLIGLIWVVFSFWELVLIVTLAVVGALIGYLLESEELRTKLRELIGVVMRRE